MEILQPLKRSSEDRWDMTRRISGDSGSTRAIGYCAGWSEAVPLGFGEALDEVLRRDVERRRRHIKKYHTDGHAESGEAYLCWISYLIDNRMKAYEDDDCQKRCEACGCWTTGRVAFMGQALAEITVCGDHATKADVYAIVEAR